MSTLATRIKYFIVDLDGCVSEPFIAPDWQQLSQLRALSEQSKHDELTPKLSICTGRPAPYAEAVAQWLDVSVPILFEQGAGMLDVNSQACLWNPQVPEGAQANIAKAKAFVDVLCQQNAGVQPEWSKRFDAGLVCPDSQVIDRLYPLCQRFAKTHCPDLVVHRTPISINMILPALNKLAGIRWFAERHNCQLDELAYIGDTDADLSSIQAVGIGIAPSNATPENQAAADWPMPSTATEAVVSAWRRLQQHNQSL